MKEYDVRAVAEELLLTTEDLREIYDLYFDETATSLELCQNMAKEKNYVVLSTSLHNIKGSSNNLRFTEIAQIAAQTEQMIRVEQFQKVHERLTELAERVTEAKNCVLRYYQKML